MFETPEQDEIALEIALKALHEIADKGCLSPRELARQALDKITEECNS